VLVMCGACSSAGAPCSDGTCADGADCTLAADCASGVCTSNVCAAASCSDGVRNGSELGIDCGGACPIPILGAGCIAGTNGSMVCTQYTSGSTFSVTLSWTAAGGHAYVDYAFAYGPNGEDYNSNGIVGGAAVNVCTSGPMSQTFELPLGSDYSYKIWHAYCVRDDACGGCGNDVTTSTGGPFGIYPGC
jgi:hypothetical protein